MRCPKQCCEAASSQPMRVVKPRASPRTTATSCHSTYLLAITASWPLSAPPLQTSSGSCRRAWHPTLLRPSSGPPRMTMATGPDEWARLPNTAALGACLQIIGSERNLQALSVASPLHPSSTREGRA